MNKDRPSLYKEFFTIDDLKLRGVQLTKTPNAIDRSAFKIRELHQIEAANDCIWYELSCTPTESAYRSVKSSIILDSQDRFTIRTAIPAAGAVVEENMEYRQSTAKVMYTYLGMLKIEYDDFVSVRCVKMGAADQKVYEDLFHVLAPFTSLYTAACLGDGCATISSSTGMKNNLRIFR